MCVVAAAAAAAAVDAIESPGYLMSLSG